MKNIFLSAGIILLLMLEGCKKEIDFTGHEGERHVVVMSQLDPDSNICINLAFTQFFLDNDPVQTIDNADLHLWINGTEYTPDAVSNGNYCFNMKPHAGDSIWFEAAIPGWNNVSAGTRVVSSPQMSNVRFSRSREFAFVHMMDMYDIRFQLDDPVDEREYYRIQLYEHIQCPAYDTVEAVDTIQTSMFAYLGLNEAGDTTSPGINNAAMASEVLLSDAYFNTPSKDVLLLTMPIVDTTGLLQRDYFVRVSTYSNETAKYLSTVWSASSMMAIFAEPVQVYSNIKGGIGIFGSSSKKMIKATYIPIDDEDDESTHNR